MSRWVNLVRRFSAWFADAVALGEHQLAEDFAAIAAILASTDHELSPAIVLLLDELELAELAQADMRDDGGCPVATLRRLAAGYQDLLITSRFDPSQEGDCHEGRALYLA